MLYFDNIIESDIPPSILYQSPPISSPCPPWTEKYRPYLVSDILDQPDFMTMLKSIIETGNLPHLILHGPPGTGKTSSAHAIAIELFGPKNIKKRMIELNASDERGINNVRNKIIEFARSSISSPDPNYPSPPYKLIILDEADAMTNEAQSALRKVMEDNSLITRFIFICNNINQIIEPIISRCLRIRFNKLSLDKIIFKLTEICKLENINPLPEHITLIANYSNGDMRSAIIKLQHLKYDNNIENVLNLISDKVLSQIRNINSTTPIIELIELINNIKLNSYSIYDVLNNINDIIIYHPSLSDLQKSKLCGYLASSELMINECADEYVQLLNIFVQMKYI